MLSKGVTEVWTARPCELGVEDCFAWLGPKPFAFLYGDGPGTRWLMFGEDPLRVARGVEGPFPAFNRRGDLPPVFPDFLGHVSYEYAGRNGPVLPPPAPKPFRFPDCHLTLYRRMRIYDRDTGILYTAERDWPRETPDGPSLLKATPFLARKAWDSDSPAGYQDKVRRVREEIAKGNVYQANLTRQERWAFQGDLRQFARRLYAANPAPHSAFLAGPDFAVVSSSPERFFRIRDGRILASPVKGTAPRGADPDADALLRRDLLGSRKNQAELAMITDLLRNDLTQVCRVPSVTVEAFPRLETFANVHHLVADVSGELAAGITLEAIFAALFPGGSISGCPKLAAIQLLRELEPNPRMVYTGAVGWFAHDLSQAEFSIAIRTVQASPTELLFGVGGAVVWGSDPAEEYEETVHKGRSIVQCLNS
jgi:para-aminobenzoate synthetase component 1